MLSSVAGTLLYARKRKTSTLPPRARRVLLALLQSPKMREAIDAIGKASNGPDIIAKLRRRGLLIHCERVESRDGDGRRCRPGRYTLDPESRALAIRLLQGQQS